MVISRMYSVKCGYRESVARILTISEGGSRKLVNPVRCSEKAKVLNLEMRGVKVAILSTAADLYGIRVVVRKFVAIM